MKNNSHVFYCMVRDFLCIYLPKQRGVSKNTVKSYREALNLLIEFLCTGKGQSLSGISFQCISKEVVEGFLQWLENERNCTISTRNQRLSALKTFLKYAAGKDKTLMPLYLEAASIPKKKDTGMHEIEFFSETALSTILSQPDRKKKNGQRDLFFLILMYDTGARVQELLDLKLGDVHADGTSPHIIVTGKGSKTRLIPYPSWRRHAAILSRTGATSTAKGDPKNTCFILKGKACGHRCPLTM